MDRRRQSWRIHTVTLGAVLVVMGMYAFSPMDTMFTRTLALLGLEEVWGALMILAGLGLGFSANTTNKYLRWCGNLGGMLVCGWTFWLCRQFGPLTPTVAATGVICLGCLATMIRDALVGKRTRCMLRETGRWDGAERRGG